MLDGYFFSADLKIKKESPAYFELILEKLGLSASEVGFVDNEEKNVESAREAGIQAEIFNEGIFDELLFEETLKELKPKIS
jgi:putative hydrolase of the HAD superfamily